MKKKLFALIHIAVWILGTAFLITGAFHDSLWFDESFSVGIVNHNIFEVCVISAADVHPPFYYVLLKLYSLIFGNSLLSLRLFSVLFASLLAGLGFTHIRKDFGEKVGFWFTTLFFLFAFTFKYAVEIRMYTLAPFLVTLMCIYAYRFYKSGLTDKKSKILFLTFSILGAYTHYYALAATGAVNFLFLLYTRKNDSFSLWKRLAKIQLVSYAFGFFCLVWQSFHVVASFWIEMKYPAFIYDSLSFFLIGDVPEDALNLTDVTSVLYSIAAVLFWGVCVCFFILFYKKNREKSAPALLTLWVLALVVGFYFAVGLIRPLYYVRYLTVLSGIIMFFLAFAFDKIKIYIKPLVLLFLAVILVLRVTPLYENMYTEKNKQIDTFVAEHIQKDDIVISDNIGLIAVLSVQYPEIKMFYYNRAGWTVENAYEAYMPGLKTVREISEICEADERVWVLTNYFNGSICDEISAGSDKEILEAFDTFILPYHNLEFGFTLME